MYPFDNDDMLLSMTTMLWNDASVLLDCVQLFVVMISYFVMILYILVCVAVFLKDHVRCAGLFVLMNFCYSV